MIQFSPLIPGPYLAILAVSCAMASGSSSTSRLMNGISFPVRYALAALQCGHHEVEKSTTFG